MAAAGMALSDAVTVGLLDDADFASDLQSTYVTTASTGASVESKLVLEDLRGLQTACSTAFGRVQLRLAGVLGALSSLLSMLSRGNTAWKPHEHRSVVVGVLRLLVPISTDEDCAEELGNLGSHRLLLRLVGDQRWSSDDDDEVPALIGDAVSNLSSSCARLGRPFPATPSPFDGASRPRPFGVTVRGEHVCWLRELRCSPSEFGTGARANFEVGYRLWGAALVLGAWILDHRDVVRGKRVLEIGAGLGLCGLCSARCGAAEVVLTDFNPRVVENLAYCADLNASSCGTNAVRRPKVDAVVLDWDDEAAATSLSPADVVLGSDIVCQESDCHGVARLLHLYLAPGGVALITLGSEKSRFGVDAFARVLTDAGLVVTEAAIAAPAAALPSGTAGEDGAVSAVHVGSAESYRHFEVRRGERCDGQLTKWGGFFDRGHAPWDTGRVASQLVELTDAAEWRTLVAEGAGDGIACCEVGCGAGWSTLWLAARADVREALGVDIVPGAVTTARRRAEDAAEASARFVCADVLSMPSSPHCGLYDLVFDSQCFHCLRTVDEIAAVRSLAALLRPGGLLLVLTGNAEEPECGPATLSRKELESAFTADGGPMETVRIQRGRFDRTPAYELLSRPPLAWVALFRRRVE